MNLHGFIKGSDNPKQTRKYEYKYIKDELLDGKDCILVKEEIFDLEKGNYININDYEPEKEMRAFWIEKSTGFILGLGPIKSAQTTATPETIMLRNISFGNVVDSDFDLPSDYKIINYWYNFNIKYKKQSMFKFILNILCFLDVKENF